MWPQATRGVKCGERDKALRQTNKSKCFSVKIEAVCAAYFRLYENRSTNIENEPRRSRIKVLESKWPPDKGAGKSMVE